MLFEGVCRFEGVFGKVVRGTRRAEGGRAPNTGLGARTSHKRPEFSFFRYFCEGSTLRHFKINFTSA